MTAFGPPKLRGIAQSPLQVCREKRHAIAHDITQALINPLDLDSALDRLPPLLHASVRLGSHDATAPVTDSIRVLLEVAILDGGDELGELALVL